MKLPILPPQTPTRSLGGSPLLTGPLYDDNKMRFYGEACARAALEEAAKVCQNERFVYSDEEWRIRCELADAIRAIEVKQ